LDDTERSGMKKTILSLFLLSVCCGLTASGQTNLIKKTLPLRKDVEIWYFVNEKTVTLNFSLTKSVLDHKSFSFHESQDARVQVMLERFEDYALKFEKEGVKPIAKSLGRISISHNNLPREENLEFTIHVSNEGKSKLIIETSDYLGVSTHVVVLDDASVRDAVQMIKLLPDLQKSAALGKHISNSVSAARRAG
jgi:hypothetical protein